MTDKPKPPHDTDPGPTDGQTQSRQPSVWPANQGIRSLWELRSQDTSKNGAARELHGPAKSFGQVLGEELDEIQTIRKTLPRPNARRAKRPPATDPNPELTRAHTMSLAGLAFSGGGIRSATFNLGILQGLAEAHLLSWFDYLSTVSGGGYIGSWLVAWIRRVGMDTVEARLIPKRADQPETKEPPEIRFLRQYSNYLTPRLGLFGLDTWTVVAVYLRNLLLNQAILILGLTAILLVPHFVVTLNAAWSMYLPRRADTAQYLISFPLLVAMSFIALNIETFLLDPKRGTQILARVATPSSSLSIHVVPSKSFDNATNPLLRQGTIVDIWDATFVAKRNAPGTRVVAFDPNSGNLGLSSSMEVKNGDIVVFHETFPWIAAAPKLLLTIVLPLFLSAAVAVCWLTESEQLSQMRWTDVAEWGARSYSYLWAFALVVLGVAHLVQSLRGMRPLRPSYVAGSTLFRWGVFVASALITGAIGGALMKLSLKCIGDPDVAVIYGVPLVIAVVLLVGAVHIGLLGICFPDPRREWFGRLGGWLLLLCLSWIVLFSISMRSPDFIRWLYRLYPNVVKWGLTPAWVLSTIGGVLAGKSKKTGDDSRSPGLDAVAKAGPYVFIIGILVALSLAVDRIALAVTIWHIPEWMPSQVAAAMQGFQSRHPHAGLIYGPLCTLLVVIVCSCMAAIIAWRVDINEFSMNLFYRNRLVRCYLGASNRRRMPNPFSGFDPDDDMLLKDLKSETGYDGPLPLINTTLNLVAGSELALQERKAESFVMSPLNCGYDVWLEKNEHRGETEDPSFDRYGYRPTEYFGYRDGGFRLGTAASISGAAASPNMGYHSSPAAAFLMTVFNVRLGWWVGNPRHSTKWQRSGPRIGLGYLFAELAGQTNDSRDYVYLSDGGHFENLGIYELVKRRCKFILASDADEDSGLKFSDLAGAIQKCRSDFGVDIKINAAHFTLAGTSSFSKWHCAIGEILYDQVDSGQTNGILVYLKTSMTSDESMDLLNYKLLHDTFPHQTTADQWFNESQFECYRALGLHVVRTLVSKLPAADPTDPLRETIVAFFTELQRTWKNPEVIVPNIS
jgi:hypothetical protein